MTNYGIDINMYYIYIYNYIYYNGGYKLDIIGYKQYC